MNVGPGVISVRTVDAGTPKPMSTVKVDFKRELRELYRATTTPSLVDVPRLRFLMIDGHGDPNVAPAFRESVSAIYGVSYAVKFALKRAAVLDYTVMPLEGLWWVPDMARFSTAAKATWNWTIMIMQPNEVTDAVYTAAVVKARSKASPLIDRVRLEDFNEGRCVQVLHRGPYSSEGPTIAMLHEFIGAHGLSLHGKHHEIYLSDPRRAAPEAMKTIIRQPVR
jgi:hypothetical protein